VLAPHHGRDFTRRAGFKAALHRSLAEHAKRGRFAVDTFQHMLAQIRQLKNATEQAARRVRQDQLARRGEPLQPRSEVRGVSDHGFFLGRSLADQVADDDQSRSDAGARRQGPAIGRRDAGKGPHDRKAGPYRAFRIVFMRPRPTEVAEHAVAHVLGQMPLEAGHRSGHGILIVDDDLAHVFRVKAPR
jgi:hypothetical protein